MTAAWTSRIDPPAAALVVFVLTYAVLGFGSLPPLRIDRTGAALIGATAMIGLGVLAPHEAVASIDFHTLALLFGMMIVVAHLRFAGFFAWLDARLLGWARTPGQAVMLTLWLSGGVSALFVNDTACLLLTPLVIETATRMQVNPVPFLLAVAMGANLGSVATIVGNPQNMLVASFSHIGYARFLVALLPAALLGLFVASGFLWLAFRNDLAVTGDRAAPVAAIAVDRGLMRKSLIVSGLLLVALLAGLTPSLSALLAASALLITRRLDPQAVYAEVDWSLLTLFAGLFVVVGGLEHSGVAARWRGGARGGAIVTAGAGGRDRDPQQPREQRARGLVAALLGRVVPARRARLAAARDGEHAGGQSHAGGIGGELDRRRARPRTSPHRVLDLPARRPAAVAGDARARHRVGAVDHAVSPSRPAGQAASTSTKVPSDDGFGTGSPSRLNSSMWRRIASRIKSTTSSRLSATATQPGRSGTCAPQLASPRSMTTMYFVILLPPSASNQLASGWS
jgi:di/tricarboxylate transporter